MNLLDGGIREDDGKGARLRSKPVPGVTPPLGGQRACRKRRRAKRLRRSA